MHLHIHGPFASCSTAGFFFKFKQRSQPWKLLKFLSTIYWKIDTGKINNKILIFEKEQQHISELTEKILVLITLCKQLHIFIRRNNCKQFHLKKKNHSLIQQNRWLQELQKSPMKLIRKLCNKSLFLWTHTHIYIYTWTHRIVAWCFLRRKHSEKTRSKPEIILLKRHMLHLLEEYTWGMCQDF